VGPRAGLDALVKRRIHTIIIIIIVIIVIISFLFSSSSSNSSRNNNTVMTALCSVSCYACISKSFWTGRLERELQMVQLSTTTCSCVAYL
jgi:hypothetical protein